MKFVGHQIRRRRQAADETRGFAVSGRIFTAGKAEMENAP